MKRAMLRKTISLSMMQLACAYGIVLFYGFFLSVIGYILILWPEILMYILGFCVFIGTIKLFSIIELEIFWPPFVWEQSRFEAELHYEDQEQKIHDKLDKI